MQDFNELQQAKAVCLKDITEALPRYSERLAAIDQRLTEYVEDAVSGNASHANIYELLGIRKTLRLMDTNADNLSLTDMKPKVNYKAGDDILASRW